MINEPLNAYHGSLVSRDVIYYPSFFFVLQSIHLNNKTRQNNTIIFFPINFCKKLYMVTNN